MMKYIFWITILVFSLTVLKAQEDRPYKKYGVDNEAGDLPVGLAIGDKAPEFELRDSEGIMRIFSQSPGHKLNKPLVLNFYRGQWCPVCVRYLSNLQDSLQHILDAGAIVWAVTPETPENAQKMDNKVKASFPIIIDASEAVMRSYDVLFDVTSAYQNKVTVGLFTSIAGDNGKDEARLPVPATYVIDTNGVIVFKQFDYNYKVRATVKDILEALKGLSVE